LPTIASNAHSAPLQTDLPATENGFVEYDAFESASLARIAAAGGLVVDAGGAAPFTKSLGRYKEWFRHIDYRTLDVSPETGPDIVADIESMPFDDGEVAAVICRSVLEHVRSPQRAVDEIARTLRPGGQLYLTVPSIYPYHAKPGPGGYPDMWRFFEDTLRALLKGFSQVEIGRVGGPATAAVLFLPFLNRWNARLRPLAARIDRAAGGRRPRGNATLLVVWAQK
jgi:SAM-dependent methyltransferase